MTVSYVPLGLAILFYFIFLKQSLRVLFLFAFLLSQGTFSGNFYGDVVGRSQVAPVCVLSSSRSLCPEEEGEEDEGRMTMAIEGGR